MTDINSPHTAQRHAYSAGLYRITTIANLLLLHWGVYWLMNGLDKFLNRTDVGLFVWYGKDRSTQFGDYLENTGTSLSALEPILYFTGIIELLVSIPLFMILAAAISGKQISQAFLEMSFVLGGVIFVGFSFFDVIFGDRAELWEHGTFLIGLLLSYKLVKDGLQERSQLV
ncbi:hypothetical protein GG681_02990 [Epibacterium sp. SM1969]|uniref:DoxX n=1 Tax=Tritonibacter aquimaris TaxID=2663379 RepID=A0A844AN58_9RHOB|nr:hypothetical protein [Tritonibacter aquimaris]MQY41593.1 hypothetical protein [Tritonibacter aquimaris]